MEEVSLSSVIPGGITSILFAALVCLLAIYYYYLTANYNYWSKQGVPGPKPKLFFGTLDFNRAIHELDAENYKKYGSMYGGYEGRNPSLYIADPALIRQVTIKDFWSFPYTRDFPTMKGDRVLRYFMTSLRGEEWKNVRTIVSPTFTTGKLKQMTHLIEECCNNLVKKHLAKFAENKEPFNMKKQMSSFTLDVIATCAFGINIDSMEDPNSMLVKKSEDIFNPKTNKVFMMIMFVFPGLLEHVPITMFMKENPWEFFRETLVKVLEHKRQQKEKRRDFLELVMEAKPEDNEEQNGESETKNIANQSTKKCLTDELIISQAVLFLIAGHETVATTISTNLYCLALNPEIQDKLRQEVDEVMDEYKDKLNYESLSKMQYLDMVVSESLRLYPTGTRVERTCVEDGYELNGVKLRKGTVIGIPTFSIHRDPKNYPDPEKFDPERFTPEAKAERDPMIYLPFGSGPRHCIAMRFALLEVKMVVASVIRQYFVKRCEKTEVPLKFNSGMAILQLKDMTLTVEKRK